jgi:hypothetical protein
MTLSIQHKARRRRSLSTRPSTVSAVGPRPQSFRAPGLPGWRAASCATTRRALPRTATGARDLPRYLAAAEWLEAAVGLVEIAFGYNDLLAVNLIDDGARLWLVDWEYAGFNSPLFDLGGLASNNELPPDLEGRLLELYFDPPTTADLPALSNDEMRLAPARGDVEHDLRAAPQGRLRLPGLHRREPRALREGV